MTIAPGLAGTVLAWLAEPAGPGIDILARAKLLGWIATVPFPSHLGTPTGRPKSVPHRIENGVLDRPGDPAARTARLAAK